MRHFYFFLSLILSFLFFGSPTLASEKIIIENVTLIDALNPVRDNMTIVLKGDVIESIEESRSKSIKVELINE